MRIFLFHLQTDQLYFDGKRKLSEINTLSVGGLVQAEEPYRKILLFSGSYMHSEGIYTHTIDKEAYYRELYLYLKSIRDIEKFMYKIYGPQDVPVIQELDLDKIPRGEMRRFWIQIISDAFGNPIYVPVMVARGIEDGPTLGLTAAVHGNELNGIPAIQRLFREINVNEFRGTLVGVPVVNAPSLMRKKRRFNDGTDLNHIMPGKPDGNVSEVYAWRFFHRIIKVFDYLLDLHTASFGRINSYYIRADMSDERTAVMARLQNAQIIVHNPPSDGTLRGAAEANGIPAITLEVGNPNTFQKGMINYGMIGIQNVLAYLDMIYDDVIKPEKSPAFCHCSYWIYTDRGGILTVLPNVTESVKKGDCVAILRNVFGDVIREYEAPEDGIVIGKSVSPINQTGGRILHLGLEGGGEVYY